MAYCYRNIFPLLSPIFLFLSLSPNLNIVEASHQPCLEYEAVSAAAVNLQYRTAFHFQPRRNWINDPNAPMYYNGIYHLFYQYNPRGSVWGKIAWGHAVSTDLIHWKELQPALYPTSPFDKYGCWSGSATILPGNKPVILYTGVVDKHWNEVQNYAIPANISDPYLREWVKPRDNPIIRGDPGVNLTAFRDPTTAWRGRDGHWRILIGSRRRHRGIAYLYRSRDFKKWVKAKNPIYSAEKTGNWECLDFFPVLGRGTNGLELSMLEKQGVKCVLKVSLDGNRFDYYTIGKYFPKVDRFVPHSIFEDGAKGLRIDYGNFYASKSFFDSRKNRRVLWGWTNESDSRMDDVEKGWAGIQGIPRKIWLDPNGKQVLQWPLEEVESLRGHKVELRNQELKKGSMVEVKGITAAQADVEVVFSFPNLDKAERFRPSWADLNAQDLCSRKGSTVEGGLGPFGLFTLASKNLEEYTPVFFRIFKAKNNNYKILLCSDASKSSLKKRLYKPSFAGFVDADISNKKLFLRSLIDHSVVESFGNGGKVCITSRVYPTLAMFNNAHLYAFNNGTQTINIETLNAWTMKSTMRTTPY